MIKQILTLHMLTLLVFGLVGCSQNIYSTLTPSGDSAQIIADISRWLFWGGLLIWLLFVSILFYALFRPREHEPRLTAIFIIGGGVVFPIVVLSVLLYFSLSPLPRLVGPAPADSLKIEVAGVQWWWRVIYILNDSSSVQLANEIRLPVNQTVQFSLTSEDVIHSFWIPSLAGKMDMIPGRKNTLTFKPTKIGVYGGICAEYCGTSHTLMKLRVIVMGKKEFDKWLKNQKTPSKKPATQLARKGEFFFRKNGCTACHTVRGVSETGVIGPDLTHVGSRLTLGAGILPNNSHTFGYWISSVDEIKPETKMPNFKMIPKIERDAISAWLEGLK